MKPTIILISGKQGSGKSTLQKALHREFYSMNKTYVRSVNFADPIYTIHGYALNIVQNLVPSAIKTKKDGKLLQLLGTEWGRATLGDDIWVQCLRAKIEEEFLILRTEAEKVVFIVGDCRFKNEFDAFPDAIKVRLHAPTNIRKARAESWRDNDTHQSEIDLDEYDLQDKFDIQVDTSIYTTDFITKTILDRI